MIEETAKQLRCVMLYKLLGQKNVNGKPTAYSDPDHRWFISPEHAKQFARIKKNDLSFEIVPYYPCFAFRFDSKWLLVACASFNGFYVEQKGKILGCTLRGKAETIDWQGKTFGQLRNFFSSLTEFCSKKRIFDIVRIVETDESTTIEEALCMADAGQESFWTLELTRRVPGWKETYKHAWNNSYEGAVRLDLDLARIALDSADEHREEDEPQIEIQDHVKERNETMKLDKSKLVWCEGSPNIEDFEEYEQCLVISKNQLIMLTKRSNEWIVENSGAPFGGRVVANPNFVGSAERYCPIIDATKIADKGEKIFSNLQWYQGPLNVEEFNEGDECLVLVNGRRLLWLTVMNGHWYVRHSGTIYADTVETDDDWIKDRCFFYCPIRPNEKNYIDLRKTAQYRTSVYD